MKRSMILATSGWYSSSKEKCIDEIESYIDKKMFLDGMTPISAIVPHAGWYFCGKLSVNTIKILKEKNGIIKNVFILGGHLQPLNLPILETFDVAETPIGKLTNNKEIVDYIIKNIDVQTVNFLQDNTIEVLMPIVNYFFGDINIIAIYLPPGMRAAKTMDIIFKKFGKNSVFIGSTDLTHYGPNYGFCRGEKSMKAIDWVKTVNDKNYIKLLLSLKEEQSVEHAKKNKSACSAGAALGAIRVAKLAGVSKGHLIGYYTSYDIHKSDNFVGYTGIIY